MYRIALMYLLLSILMFLIEYLSISHPRSTEKIGTLSYIDFAAVPTIYTDGIKEGIKIIIQIIIIFTIQYI